ncbi:MAG: c-type cytochrome [Flavobacteriales bacterium]|nr:c-type cytochrome [Flavobacteriales bacterium]MCB9364022.1 c-type cytochrome [Flavobacteriales bacterium]
MLKFGVGFILISILCGGCDNNTKFKSPKRIELIDTLQLTVISDSLMQRGQRLFKDKCAQCHTMEFKNSGPDISDILANRKPEWVVNFLLNKEEMLQRDSIAIRTRVKYNEDCGTKITTKNEALEILEYLRIYQLWLHEFNVK